MTEMMLPDMLSHLSEPPLFALAMTFLLYALAKKIYAISRSFLLHPVLLTIGAVILILKLLGIEYEAYFSDVWPVHFLLGPAVVALGLPLFEELRKLREQSPAILISLLFGSITGIISVTIPLLIMKVPPFIVASMAPKSVTTPIAIVISEGIGGEPSLTAAVVVITGILGAVTGPLLLGILGISSGIPYGLALGAASHGIGTARAVEKGELEGAASGLALCLNGISTSILAPPIVTLLLQLKWY